MIHDHRRLQDVAAELRNEGYESLRTGDIVAAQEKFQVAEWIEELKNRRDGVEVCPKCRARGTAR